MPLFPSFSSALTHLLTCLVYNTRRESGGVWCWGGERGALSWTWPGLIRVWSRSGPVVFLSWSRPRADPDPGPDTGTDTGQGSGLVLFSFDF
jgi:hypothetical protein